MATFKVTTPEGKSIELEIYTPDQLTGFVNRKQKNPKDLQAAVTYIKALGRKVSEISAMDEAERKAFILERYKELGVGASAKKGAAVKSQTSAPPAAAAKKGAAKPAAKVTPPPADDDDDDDDDDATPAAAEAETDGDTASSEDIAELRAEVAALTEQLGALHDKFDEQTHFVLEAHSLLRQIATATTGFSEEEVAGISRETYATLVGIQGEDDAGNDD